MLALKTINAALTSLVAKPIAPVTVIPIAGMKHFTPPKTYDGIGQPERPKLRMMLKVPNYLNIRPPKMQKKLILMRGPEMEHNKKLVHKQFGVIALTGGRIKYPHIEMARLSIGRKMDTKRMFAIWRIPEPWQPLHKRGIGIQLGGGKGAIDHYCTPVRAGRVILEMGGDCEFGEVKPLLDHVAHCLPFKAKTVSQEMLEEEEEEKKRLERENLNPYTKKYVMQNNLNGCHKWMTKYDHRWFGEYL